MQTSDSRRSKRSTRARPTDDELLDAAVAVFAERGFAAATMSALAEQCDSTKPTLYAHFGDKETLFDRLLAREADRCRTTLFAAYSAAAELGLEEQVEASTRALFDYAATNPDGFRLLLGGDLTLTAVRVREQLLHEVHAHLATNVHAYLTGPHAGPHPPTPAAVEHQLAAILAGVALSAAQHALAHDTSLDDACAMATAFSAAALKGLEATARRRPGRASEPQCPHSSRPQQPERGEPVHPR